MLPILNDEQITKIKNTTVHNETYATMSAISDLFAKNCKFKDELIKGIVDIFDITFFALTPEEKRQRLHEELPSVIEQAFQSFIDKSQGETASLRTKIERSYANIVDKSFSSVADEVNRGCMIPATAIAADAKNDEYTRTIIQYGAMHKITIPCEGAFISTDCIETIKNSVATFEEIKNDRNTQEQNAELAKA